MSKNHHFCWRQHQNQPIGTFPEIFVGKYRKFSWWDISIPISIAIACILREKRGGGKFAPPPTTPPPNKSSKSFRSDKYQNWYANQVAAQIRRGVSPHDVKVDIRLLVVKPLHARWVIEFYNHMQLAAGRQTIINGFRKAGIKEAYDQALQLSELADNPFLEIDITIS